MRKRKPREFHSTEVLLRGSGYNSTALERILPHSRPTCQKMLKRPGLFTMQDLCLIQEDGNITLEELLEALRKDMK